MVKLTSEKPAIQSSRDAKFKGVRKRKWGKFVSEIRLPNSRERIWLGSYDTAEKAARAFDAASFCLRGNSAKFNFPNNPPPEIGCGRANLTPAEIQAIAARFANSEPPITHLDQQSTSTSELESLSPSVSDGTMWLECEWPAMEYLDTYNLDYGIFSGFDDFINDVIGPSSMTADIGDEQDNVDGIIVSESFLWNF